MALFQRSAPSDHVTQLLAVNSAVTLLSAPVGTVLGGVLVSHWGARGTLLFSACGLIAVVLTVLLLLSLLRPVPASGAADAEEGPTAAPLRTALPLGRWPIGATMSTPPTLSSNS